MKERYLTIFWEKTNEFQIQFYLKDKMFQKWAMCFAIAAKIWIRKSERFLDRKGLFEWMFKNIFGF